MFLVFSRLEVNLRRDEPGGIQSYLIKYCQCVDEIVTINTSITPPERVVIKDLFECRRPSVATSCYKRTYSATMDSKEAQNDRNTFRIRPRSARPVNSENIFRRS